MKALNMWTPRVKEEYRCNHVETLDKMFYERFFNEITQANKMIKFMNLK